jgi:hypothetical protein
MDIIEGHPIPQDITGFQFRIIGNLTIKQFAYLAVGLLLAWLIFAISFPLFIKIPFALLFGGTGIIFAFVQIQGRPADTMLMLFFRAVMHANEYSYDRHPSPSPTHQSTVVHPQPTVNNTPATLQATMPVATTTDIVPAETIASLPQREEEPETQEKQPEDVHEKLSQVLLEKQQLEEKLQQLQQQIQQNPTTIPSGSVIPNISEQTKIPASGQTSPVVIQRTPDAPNVLLGTVKDPRGNPLPNILIEVKDKEDNPVRAFKTSPQGTFASATPLMNGTYTVVLEDSKKQQQFDPIVLHADGSVMEPLEVISVDERENLRKTLFGG